MLEEKYVKKNKAVFGVFIILQSILYGVGNPVTKIAFESVSVYWCLALRFSIATAVFMILFGKQVIRELKKAKIKDYLPASLCMAAAYISVNLALQWTTATNVGFLMSLPVVIAPVLARIVLKRKYSWRHLPVQAVVVAGLYLLCCGENGFVVGKGEVFALITAAAVAGSLVFGEHALKAVGAVTISAAQAGITAVISLVMALLFEEIRFAQMKPEAWAVIVYLAVGCTFAAYLLQNAAVKELSSQTVSMLQTSQPVATAVCSYIILGEILTVKGYIGAGVIIICIIAEGIIAAKTTKNSVQAKAG